MSADERFAEVKAIFDAALDLPASERTAFLRERCGADDALRRDVESLLAFEESGDGFLKDAHRGAGPAMLADEMAIASDASIPDRIAQYRILRKIGEGGMGVVYEAEQESPRRRVALKVIRSAFLTDEVVKRFRHEVQLLGQLDHAGVAHIYEAGTATIRDSSWPFFAMELVDGRPLDHHATSVGLSVEERLELLARVADAVHHAHAKGIVHRDLKPANVLVKSVRSDETTSPTGEPDRIGQPKVLDFGVARATDADIQITTVQTHAGQIVGTLAYMSPEQVEGRRDIDRRCDVYSLGVILYELLAGRRPFDLTGRPVAEAARMIVDDDPTSLGDDVPSLRGDVATIVAKAMEKDRARRYDSTAELAEDIRRFLRSEPISARPASRSYRVRRFVRRNRPLVAGLAAAFVALAAGLVATTVLLLKTREERDAKVAALERSDAVTEFLSDMLLAADPGLEGRDVTVLEVLDQASADVGVQFADRPVLESDLRGVIGNTYNSLGEYARADSHLTVALALATEHMSPDDPRIYEISSILGAVRYFQGDYESALEYFNHHLDGYERGALERDGSYSVTVQNVAFLTMSLGHLDDARELFQTALDYSTEHDGPDAEATITIGANLAMLEHRARRYDEAERIYLDAIERSRRVRGNDHPETLLLVANLASLYGRVGREAEALPLLQETLTQQESVFGPSHSKTLITLGNLAQSLARVGRTDEARTLVDDGLARSIEAYGEGERSTLLMTAAKAGVLDASGDHEGAIALLVPNLAAVRATMGDGSDAARRDWFSILAAYRALGRADDIIRVSREYADAMAAEFGEAHPRTVEARVTLARAYRDDDRPELAERELATARAQVGEATVDSVNRALDERRHR